MKQSLLIAFLLLILATACNRVSPSTTPGPSTSGSTRMPRAPTSTTSATASTPRTAIPSPADLPRPSSDLALATILPQCYGKGYTRIVNGQQPRPTTFWIYEQHGRYRYEQGRWLLLCPDRGINVEEVENPLTLVGATLVLQKSCDEDRLRGITAKRFTAPPLPGPPAAEIGRIDWYLSRYTYSAFLDETERVVTCYDFFE